MKVDCYQYSKKYKLKGVRDAYDLSLKSNRLLIFESPKTVSANPRK
jgi:hypothetical protein